MRLATNEYLSVVKSPSLKTVPRMFVLGEQWRAGSKDASFLPALGLKFNYVNQLSVPV